MRGVDDLTAYPPSRPQSIGTRITSQIIDIMPNLWAFNRSSPPKEIDFMKDMTVFMLTWHDAPRTVCLMTRIVLVPTRHDVPTAGKDRQSTYLRRKSMAFPHCSWRHKEYARHSVHTSQQGQPANREFASTASHAGQGTV